MKSVLVLRLTCIEKVGIGKAFLIQLEYMDLFIDWITFRDEFCLPGTILDENTKRGQRRLFCQLRGLPVITVNEVWLPQILKRTGYVARHVVLQN
jgi:hypothetical protein